MERRDGENGQIGICRRLFSIFMTGTAFQRWKRFIVQKRPVQGDMGGTMEGLVQVEQAKNGSNKEVPVLSVLPEEINQGTQSEGRPLVAEKEHHDHKNKEKGKTEKKGKETEKEKVLTVVQDVVVENDNNNQAGVAASLAPTKDAAAAPPVDAEKELGVGVESSGAAARRSRRSRTKKSVSFKDEKDDINEKQKKDKEDGGSREQPMDLNTKFQKFIDDKKQAMRQGSGVWRKPSS